MQKKINNKTIILQVGDITKYRGDVIVNAANPYLAGGSGVDGAIHQAGGPTILKACQKIIQQIGRLPNGKAIITHGGQLQARNVIHAVGPIYKESKEKAPRILKETYESCLKLADKMNLKDIAFPSISTGAYGYPVEEASIIAMNAVVEYLMTDTVIEKVSFYLYTYEDYMVYMNALEKSLASLETKNSRN